MSDPFDLAALSTVHNVCHVLHHIEEKVPAEARMNATLLCIEGLITEVVEELSAPTGWHLLDIDVVEKATEGTELPPELWRDMFNFLLNSWKSGIRQSVETQGDEPPIQQFPSVFDDLRNEKEEVDGIEAWQHMGRTNASSNTR